MTTTPPASNTSNTPECISTPRKARYCLWKPAWVFLLSCTFLPVLPAQSAYKTEYLSVRDGLSYRWVLDMLQDRHGQLWFATYDGLNRYDGHRFEVFRHEEHNSSSLQNNRIQCIVEDRQGLLWIQTETGMDYFNPANGRFEHLQSVGEPPGQPLRTIVGDRQSKQVWGVFYAAQETGKHEQNI